MERRKSYHCLKNVSKSFDKKVVFRNLSFNLKEGEILGVLGYSGVGKSTLLNAVCGFINIDSGKIKAPDASHLGYSTQEPSFYDELTAEENLKFYGRLLKLKGDQLNGRINELFSLFDLERVRKIKGGSLSVGQKKRLDLACALIHSPKVLIMDEPTANLDFRIKDEILEYVKKINRAGVSIIFVSHFIEEIEKLAHRVLLVKENKSEIVMNASLKHRFLRFLENE